MTTLTQDGRRFAVNGSDDAELTSAAIAAIVCVLEAETAAASVADAPRERWSESARAQSQGLAMSRLPVQPTWNAIERLRRAGRGGSGLTGL